MKPIRLIELFAGIGAQATALKRLGVPFEHYRAVEFDKFAIKSYNAVHHTDFPTMDITTTTADDLGIVDTDKYTYIMTYSFPCQDLSVAGKGKGMAKGSGTRSGLLWQVERILNECNELPQVLLMENVPQVHGKKNLADFEKWCEFLEGKGYHNYWQDLNAKHYGVAQNRNRTFMVSLLSDVPYVFPEPIPLTKTMKDYLEDIVDEKFYINNEKAQMLIHKLIVNGKLGKKRERERERERERASTLQSTSQESLMLQTVSRQEPIEESVITERKDQESSRVTCWLNLKKIDKTSDVATTLCARDYKGFGTGFNVMNGVIECD